MSKGTRKMLVKNRSNAFGNTQSTHQPLVWEYFWHELDLKYHLCHYARHDHLWEATGYYQMVGLHHHKLSIHHP